MREVLAEGFRIYILGRDVCSCARLAGARGGVLDVDRYVVMGCNSGQSACPVLFELSTSLCPLWVPDP